MILDYFLIDKVIQVIIVNNDDLRNVVLIDSILTHDKLIFIYNLSEAKQIFESFNHNNKHK
jgi:hypothetical protein